MATITGLTAARMLEIEANAVKATSKTVSATAANVAAGAGANGTIALGKAYRLDKLTVTKACRLRLYISAAHRTADADRPRTDDPIGDHGCIAEIFATSDLLTLTLLPMPHGYVPTGTTYYSVVNDEGTAGDIVMTFIEHVLET